MPWDPWLPRCSKNLARTCQDSQDASKRVNPGRQNLVNYTSGLRDAGALILDENYADTTLTPNILAAILQKKGPFRIFQHPLCRKISKNEAGKPFGEKNLKKNLTMSKKVKGDHLVLPGIVCYAEKKRRNDLFWFSSLGQMLHFETINFLRLPITFKNYFGQFVWNEKKSDYNSRVSLHEAPTEKRKPD